MRLKKTIYCLSLMFLSLISFNSFANCSQLIDAVCRNDFDKVLYLLRTKAKIRRLSLKEYKRAILLAAYKGNVEIFFLLSPHIADADFFKCVFKILMKANYNEVIKYYTSNRNSRENDE